MDIISNLIEAHIFREQNGVIEFLLLKRSSGEYYPNLWQMVSGKIKENETAYQTAKREIKEEIGLEVEVLDEIGRNEYVANHPEKGKLRKQVVYFLAKAEYKDLILEKDSGGLDEARWFRLSEIQNIKTYGDILPFITKAITLISREK